ncbi:hypothetical protein AU210_001727 [Fusarium oxysporum f. sp. radicis-cucumerinum]|uniref:Apopolysialoglycoprotein n=1 Tax=Fusarium oxysporum f. sp. radicis-cucumerinum TaxID=327505 RepID=A0A2H3HXE4_FUSOX|nr:hypothetical protein AU210_001727 [Fusarium oxysporum f. sp. radicis-cucumerinum]
MAPGTRRANRSGYAEHDDFEGLPVRQWRQEWINVAPPQQQEQTQQNDIWSIDLPHGMPKDSHLLPAHSQELLAAARSGRLYKRSAPAEEEEVDADAAPEKPEKKEEDTSARGFSVKVWKQLPRNIDTPGTSHLAKRQKNTVTIASRTVEEKVQGPTVTRATVRRIDAAGNPYTEEVTLSDGQQVQGEIVSTRIEQAPVPGSEPLATTPVPNRRRPPPPKRKAKAGPGRGKKKIKNPPPEAGAPAAAPVPGADGAASAVPIKPENPTEAAIKQEREDSANQDTPLENDEPDTFMQTDSSAPVPVPPNPMGLAPPTTLTPGGSRLEGSPLKNVVMPSPNKEVDQEQLLKAAIDAPLAGDEKPTEPELTEENLARASLEPPAKDDEPQASAEEQLLKAAIDAPFGPGPQLAVASAVEPADSTIAEPPSTIVGEAPEVATDRDVPMLEPTDSEALLPPPPEEVGNIATTPPGSSGELGASGPGSEVKPPTDIQAGEEAVSQRPPLITTETGLTEDSIKPDDSASITAPISDITDVPAVAPSVVDPPPEPPAETTVQDTTMEEAAQEPAPEETKEPTPPQPEIKEESAPPAVEEILRAESPNLLSSLMDKLDEQHAEIESMKQKASAEPAPESVPEPVAEVPAEAVIEPAVEPVSEPMSELIAEPAAEPVPETAADPITETAPESTTEHPAETLADLVAEPATEPAADVPPESALIPEAPAEPADEPMVTEEVKTEEVKTEEPAVEPPIVETPAIDGPAVSEPSVAEGQQTQQEPKQD